MSQETERVKFKAASALIMGCQPGNADHDDGEPITILTLAERLSGTVIPVSLSLRDSQQLALNLLVSLWTSNDPVAEKVLTRMFPHNSEGQFEWPTEDSPDWER
ncbi:MAG TPA: hypothetical protein VGB55_04235 [Tepidisphaeraceae bacterium]